MTYKVISYLKYTHYKVIKMLYNRNHVERWDIRLSELYNDTLLCCVYTFSILFGFLFSNFGKMIGMSVDMEGVEYYREAHLSGWNSTIHIICMPFTTYGILLAFPNLLRLDILSGKIFIWALFITYAVHYLTINPVIGLFFIVIYMSPISCAYKDYKYSKYNFFKGFMIAFTSLLIQEYIGHYLGGDIPSRVEAIPNAIVYANFYATYAILL